jgi:hypothetical protein
MKETFENLQIREDRIADLDVVLSILEEAARWLVCRGSKGGRRALSPASASRSA